jgi:hypothetical protein
MTPNPAMLAADGEPPGHPTGKFALLKDVSPFFMRAIRRYARRPDRKKCPRGARRSG